METNQSEADLLAEIARLRERVAALEADAVHHRQAEQLLHDAETEYHLVADFTYDWEYWRDADDVLRYVSPACERITGYTPAQFMAHADLMRDITLPEDQSALAAHRQTVEDAPGPHEVQFRIRHANGEIRWIDHACQPVYGEDGTFLGWRASIRDITERKQAELLLHESQQTLETLMRNLPGMVYRCQNDEQWTMEYLSDGCYALTGYDPVDLLHNRAIAYADLIYPEDRENVWQSVQKAVQVGEPYELVYRLRTRDGREKWVWEQGREITLNDGSTCLEGLITDITLRIRVEEALRLSESRARALLDAVPDLMIQLDREGICLRYHDGGMGTYVPPEDFLGRAMHDVLPEELTALTRAAIDQALETREIQIFQYQLPLAGEMRDYEARVVASGDDEVAVIIREITSRVQAERALRASEERLRTLIDATPDIICFKDGDGRWLLANRAMLEIFGLPEASYRGMTDLELTRISPRYRVVFGFYHETDQLAWTKRSTHRHDEVLLGPDGLERHYDVIKVPLFYPDGKRKALVVLGRDITTRKKAERLLHHREQEFRMLAENNPDLIARFDRQFRFLYVNPAVTRITGIPSAGCIGKTSAEIGFPESSVAQWNGALERAFQTGQAVDVEFSYESPHNGMRYNQSHIMPELSGAGIVLTLLSVTRDITDLKQAEEHRITLAVERERVAVLARFLENVSHEFRTPLSVIYTGLEALERSALLDESNARRVNRIQEQAAYIGRLVDAMMTMARLDGDPQYEFGLHDLAIIMGDIKTDIERMAASKCVTVALDLPDDLPLVRCDPVELRRALFNIFENAVEYTPDGGTISIRVRAEETQAIIECSDTGPGLDPQDQPHVFERFYRTDKARTGRHAGLGLAIAKTIIDAHGGRIDVRSTPGAGSTFSVVLPQTTEP